MKIVHVKKILVFGVSLMLVAWLAGCGSSAETSDSDASLTSQESAAAAVAALFNGGSVSAMIAKAAEVGEEPVPNDTCSFVLSGEIDHEHPIVDEPYSDPGSYGSLNVPLHLEEEDFCTLPDETENVGSGPDGLGLVASFELTGDIDGNCEDEYGNRSVITMKSGSYGVWRETEATEEDVAYSPQIFGTFIIEEGDEEMLLHCTIYLDEDETALFADCTNDREETIVQDSSAECNFAAE